MRRVSLLLRTAPSALRGAVRANEPVITDEAEFTRMQRDRAAVEAQAALEHPPSSSTSSPPSTRATTVEDPTTATRGHEEDGRGATTASLGGFGAAFRRLFGGGSVHEDSASATSSSRDADIEEIIGRRLRNTTRSAPSTTSSSASSFGSVPPRSVLFVPCHNKKALHKIATLNADCFILDLEDAVPLSKKQEARQNLFEFLRDAATQQGGENDDGGSAGGAGDAASLRATTKKKKTRFVVRVNSPRTDPANGFVDLDLVGTLHTAIEGVGIPKTLQEDAAILQPLLCPTHELWAFFETPLSILQAAAICQQAVLPEGHPSGALPWRYAVMGLNDLGNDMGLPLPGIVRSGTAAAQQQQQAEEAALASKPHHPPFGSHRAAFQFAMSTVVTAAKAYGLHPLDGVCNDPNNLPLLEQELAEAKALGFVGKTLIHPSQIAPCHAWMSPSSADVEWAQKVVNAAALRVEGGAFSVEGKMVEDLHVRQAQRTLDRSALSNSS